MKAKEYIPTISIIVPVYNSYTFLPVCLDSIISQTFSGWEMILVDDGSTDGSELICNEYAKSDERIICIHQQNQGPSAARNTGLNHAKGNYITFIDADDVMLSSRYLETLYKVSSECNSEISICQMVNFNQQIPKVPTNQTHIIYKLTTGPDFCSRMYPEYNHFFPSSTSKLIHHSCFISLRFPEELSFAEDCAISPMLYFPCKRIALIDTPMYGRRVGHIGQYQRTEISQKLSSIEAAFSAQVAYYKNCGRDDLAQNALLDKEQHIMWAIRSLRDN